MNYNTRKEQQYWAFQWNWVLNPGPPYTSCWDALVSGTAAPGAGGEGTNPDPNNTNDCPIGAPGCFCTMGGFCDPGILCNATSHLCFDPNGASSLSGGNMWMVSTFAVVLFGYWMW